MGSNLCREMQLLGIAYSVVGPPFLGSEDAPEDGTRLRP